MVCCCQKGMRVESVGDGVLLSKRPNPIGREMRSRGLLLDVPEIHGAFGGSRSTQSSTLAATTTIPDLHVNIANAPYSTCCLSRDRLHAPWSAKEHVGA